MAKFKLTKAELAALDLLIHSMQTSKSSPTVEANIPNEAAISPIMDAVPIVMVTVTQTTPTITPVTKTVTEYTLLGTQSNAVLSNQLEAFGKELSNVSVEQLLEFRKYFD